MATSDLNFSNNGIKSSQIEGLLALFEGSGDTGFDFWFQNVCDPNMDEDTKEMLRRNFPRQNYFREVILKLAWSIPLPTVCAARNDEDELDENKSTEDELSKLEAKLMEMQGRRNWEGTKDFKAALIWWRCFAFVTGDIFVKLPLCKEVGPDGNETGKMLCYPERMPSQRTYIKMDPNVRKVINGYRFMYYLGTGQFTENGDMSQLVTEIIETNNWQTYDPITPAKDDTVGQMVLKGERATEQGRADRLSIARQAAILNGEEPPEDIDDPNNVTDTKNILPVAHLAWEEREESARGLPLALRLADKVLHIQSIQMDRRLGGKLGSGAIFVAENVNTDETFVPTPGSTVSVKTEVPWAPAKFSAVQSSFDDSPLKGEYVDALRDLYHTAFLPFDIDHENGAVGDKSGKALQMLSKDQVKYREAFQAAEGSFLQDKFSKACTLEGLPTEPDDVQVKYDDIITPDATERLAEANFYMDNGYEDKALQVMGIDEDEAVEMVRAKGDKRAEALLGSKPNGDLEDELEDEDEPADKKPPVAKA